MTAAHTRRAETRGVSLEQQLRDVLAETARPTREELIADVRTRSIAKGLRRRPSSG